jgi:HEAT repeat protein
VGLFDFLKRGKEKPAEETGKPGDRKLSSLGKTASDKRAQSYDRDEAIRGLIEIGTPDAAALLIKRFTLKVDPSITDLEEKQLALDGIVSIGRCERGKRVSDVGRDPKEISSEPLSKADVAALRDAVVGHARAYCKSAENLTLALKVMRELLDDASYEKELLELLSPYDTEYTRNVEPKLNLLAGLEDVRSETVRKAVEPYLEDANETVRFHAVATTFTQGNRESIAPLVALLKNEESIRIKNKICEGFLTLGWTVPSDLRADFLESLSDVHEYRATSDGKVQRA